MLCWGQVILDKLFHRGRDREWWVNGVIVCHKLLREAKERETHHIHIHTSHKHTHTHTHTRTHTNAHTHTQMHACMHTHTNTHTHTHTHACTHAHTHTHTHTHACNCTGRARVVSVLFASYLQTVERGREVQTHWHRQWESHQCSLCATCKLLAWGGGGARTHSGTNRGGGVFNVLMHVLQALGGVGGGGKHWVRHRGRESLTFCCACRKLLKEEKAKRQQAHAASQTTKRETGHCLMCLSQAVEVFACRVKPVDGDTEWTRSVRRCLLIAFTQSEAIKQTSE